MIPVPDQTTRMLIPNCWKSHVAALIFLEVATNCSHGEKLLLPYCGRETRTAVFGLSENVRFRPACSATETSQKIKICW